MHLHYNIFARNNNFNLIRIYLSLSVVFFHSYELSEKAGLKFVNQLFNGERAVQAFFIISGYLIMKSYFRSTSAKDFFLKRVRRIYPAYLAIILLCAVLGCLISSHSTAAYFTSPLLYKYIVANLLFLNFIQPSLPGVFTDNIFTTVNGSLWTLKIEVGYYLLVPVITFFRAKINVHLLYGILFLSSLGYYVAMKQFSVVSNNDTYLFLSRQIPGQLFYFIAGAWVYELEKKSYFFYFIKWSGMPCLLILFFPVPVAFQCLLLTAAVFFFAYIVPEIKYPYRDHDISYGLYIYHFPVIQVLLCSNFYNYSSFAALIYTLAAVVSLSIISWLCIERPFIVKRKANLLF